MTTSLEVEREGRSAWPSLPLSEWQDTQATLHRWIQIVGKTRMALTPAVNHSWHCTLYLTSRGLTTSPMPGGSGTVEVELDFIDHHLLIRSSNGATRRMALAPRSVADFYVEYMGLLAELGVRPKFWARPNELQDTLPFAEDEEHRSYDPDFANRCWQIVSQTDRVLQEFRSRFIGKCSPVHFFWGAFDLACTRFNGETAPQHPGGVPNLPDTVVREAYSHQCISAGWWPGGGPVSEPAFYSYTYPEPAGFADARVRPAEAYYQRDLKEFVLPYDAVRAAGHPDDVLLEFFQSTYEAGASLGGWNRSALERTGRS